MDSTLKKPIKNLGFIAFLCIVVAGCGGKNSAGTAKADTSASANIPPPPPPPPAVTQTAMSESTWSYDTTTDKMRGIATYRASMKSTNQLQFDFPYNGGSTGSITLRKTGKSVDVLFEISPCQFDTRIDGTPIAVKFDNSRVETFTGNESEDNQTGLLFLSPASRFANEIKKAHHVTIEAPYYQEGQQQLEFDVNGLQWQ